MHRDVALTAHQDLPAYRVVRKHTQNSPKQQERLFTHHSQAVDRHHNHNHMLPQNPHAHHGVQATEHVATSQKQIIYITKAADQWEHTAKR